MIGVHLFWDYFGRFANMLTQIITSIVLTRLLLPEDFGIIGMAFAVNGIARLFANFGFSSYIIQQKEEDEKTINSIFWFSLGLGIALFLIIYFFADSIALYYEMPQLSDILVITGLSLILGMVGTIPNALLLKRLEFKVINIRNIVIALFSGVIGIVLAYNGFGVWSLVIQQIVNGALGVIVALLLVKWLPKLIFCKEQFMKSFHFGKYMFLASFIDGIYSRLDVFLIGKLFSFSSLGLYTRAQTLDGTVSGLSASSLLNVLFPTIAKIKDETEKLKDIYLTYFEHITFVFCLLSSILYLSAEPLFFYLFGERWLPSADFFKILVLSSFAYPLSSLMLSIIEARGNSKNFLYADIIKKVIFFPAYLIVWFYTIEAFLFALFFLNIVGTFVNLYYLNKEILVGYKSSILLFFKYFIPSIALAVLMDYAFPSSTNILHALLKILGLLAIYFGVSYFQKSTTLYLAINYINKRNDKRN
jgi:teichuronic acid exporter